MSPHDGSDRAEVVDGIEYRYSADWIHELEPEDKWRLYWSYMKMMENRVLPGDRVLEIGVGNGFMANYLRSKKVNVTTLDIDDSKKPDIVANIVSYDFPGSYDHCLAFNVLEHVPFDRAQAVLTKLAKVVRKTVFISIPRCETVWLRVRLQVPRLIDRSLTIATRRRRSIVRNHFWEVGDAKVTRRTLNAMFSASGLRVCSMKRAQSKYNYALEPVAAPDVVEGGMSALAST